MKNTIIKVLIAFILAMIIGASTNVLYAVKMPTPTINDTIPHIVKESKAHKILSAIPSLIFCPLLITL